MEILGAQEFSFFFTSSVISRRPPASKTITTQGTMLRLKLAMTNLCTIIAERHSRKQKLLLSLYALMLLSLRTGGQSVGEWRPSEMSGFHYPALARSAGIEGTVTVDCKIELDGTVSNVVVISGNGFLSPTAISAARTWRFKSSEGSPAKGTFRLTFEFHLGKRLKSERCPEESERLTFEYPNLVRLLSDRPPVEVGTSKTKS